MFELTREEILGISQVVTSSRLKFSPRAFPKESGAYCASPRFSIRDLRIEERPGILQL